MHARLRRRPSYSHYSRDHVVSTRAQASARFLPRHQSLLVGAHGNQGGQPAGLGRGRLVGSRVPARVPVVRALARPRRAVRYGGARSVVQVPHILRGLISRLTDWN